MAASEVVLRALTRLRELREHAGLTTEQMDGHLLIGPGWTAVFESGTIVPSMDVLLAMLNVLGVPPSSFFANIPGDKSVHVVRALRAEARGHDVVLHFGYADYDASHCIEGATLDQFRDVVKQLQGGLAQTVSEHVKGRIQAVQRDAVVRAFLRAVELWPEVNPSDLWWFLIYRAYCDPFNHPASSARRDLGQSWKRTAGWALEEVLVRHYRPFLEPKGIRLAIEHSPRKKELLEQLNIEERLEPDKVDVLLTAMSSGQEVCFGVVHVKASFAERRTDDVPMSRALVDAGYTSPLWTMDCKSTPSANPTNHGELGCALGDGADRRSAKRKDIEVDGYFSACFSYNSNTIPTPPDQDAKARICVCDFKDPDDDFARFIVSEWQRFNR